jgi:hypothetical protein
VGSGPLENVARLAAERLVECYHRSRRPDWPWFESRMTYANAVLPHALFDAAERWPAEGFLQVAQSSLAFLDLVTTADDVFWPIGNRDWYSHGEEKSLYDQQPVEAATMASAALTAYRLQGEGRCLAMFWKAYGWFHGRNSLGQPLAERRSGACFDGLMPTGVNQNQGAESTLAYLWSELQRFEVEKSPSESANTVAIGS